MNRILIFGNSGAGKSTLAKRLRCSMHLAHLDLDTIAWESSIPPKRKCLNITKIEIDNFTSANNNWIIEGCYTDLLTMLAPCATKVIFMNLSIEKCITNAKMRPWEPHKYPSEQAQNANLAMLIDWISQYEKRSDTFSYSSHMRFYNEFDGQKTMLTSNQEYNG